ncbi:hypothetical protein HX038_08195 [Myroides odoratimimus]|uniref:hypothetical protein n=1 Tax=Myroides odoratimimus TaxID=76832 RepID=UPI002575DC67|nr:hypothetical protein [Myroides odoratimimus]MDM1410735.1 hypothetical protein [Myroides odoratimimus]MDM1519365.1 hypothetical protein [Myroides odoratimimus]MEC4007683.1 hypothetical protein [Myroides odoratimimus]
MAVFKGTLREFNDYVGPLARNIVANMARKLKAHTTCREEGCNRRKPLEAAHIKGKERPTIIANILSDYKIDHDLYEVDLEEFKSKFIAQHQPIEDVILPMCKEHHLAYDKKHKIESELPVVIDELVNEEGQNTYTEVDLEKLSSLEFKSLENAIKKLSISDIKDKISEELNLVKQQISVSNISDSNGLWNFDINKSKFTEDFAFVFYDQNAQTYKVSVFKGNSLELSNFGEKNNGQVVRFFVDANYQDRSGFKFNIQ